MAASVVGQYYPNHTGVAEVDAGTLPVISLIGTITDSRCTSSSLVTAVVDYTAPTGKDLDEIEMDTLVVKCGTPTPGSFSYILQTTDRSYIEGLFRIKYQLNNN